MRTFRYLICLTIASAAWMAGEASAQKVSRHRSVRQQSERAARASWRPTRTHIERDAAAEGDVRQDVMANQLRLVDHITVEDAPLPAPQSESISIVQTPEPDPIASPTTPPPPVRPAPLDGQVQLAPVHEDVVTLPGGPCGCGDSMCDGGCDSFCGTGSCCDDCGSCGLGDCYSCGEVCSTRAWRPCVTLCIPQDGWVSFEYLSWYQDGMLLPPLVTTSTDSDIDRERAGVLTDPSTRILVGGEALDRRAFSGGRLRLGFWLDRCHHWAIGGDFFGIGRESESFVGTSTGDPILARPFFNTQLGTEDSELVAFPGVVSGTVGVIATSEFTGGGFHFRRLRNCWEGCSRFLFCGCPEPFVARTDAMFGYRYVELQEQLVITENLVSTNPQESGTFDILDRFDTRNQFNGFDVGWIYRRTRGFWSIDGSIRLAVGNTRQTVTIDGRTIINDPTTDPTVQTFPGGLLTQTSNIGTYRRNEFAVVPEFNVNVGYQLTDCFRLFLGYTGIYWSNVVRPGDQIDRDVNPTLLPPPDPFAGALRPAFAFDNTDYWAQGINIGGELRW